MSASVLDTGEYCVAITLWLDLFRWHLGFRCPSFPVCFSSPAESGCPVAGNETPGRTKHSPTPQKDTLAPSKSLVKLCSLKRSHMLYAFS